jgi:AcrR family transcriptional regulator
MTPGAPSTSARPRRKKAGTRGMPRAAREQQILDVAGRAFARGDFHTASMDEIAELAGISKPMLYSYFGSKEGLYVAYIRRTGRELVERINGAVASDERPVSRLRARIEEFLTFVEEHRDGWVVLFREASANRPLAEEVAELRGQLIEAIRRMLQRGGAPQPPTPAAEAIAHAIVGAGESLANWWLKHPEVRREQVVDWYVQVVQAAVGAASARG